MNRLKLTYSSAHSAVLAIIIAVVLTIAGESSAAFKTFLKSWTGHHWTTKSVAVAIAYFGALAIIYGTTKSPSPRALRKSLWLVTAAAILGYLVLLFFFINHYLSE